MFFFNGIWHPPQLLYRYSSDGFVSWCEGDMDCCFIQVCWFLGGDFVFDLGRIVAHDPQRQAA